MKSLRLYSPDAAVATADAPEVLTTASTQQPPAKEVPKLGVDIIREQMAKDFPKPDVQPAAKPAPDAAKKPTTTDVKKAPETAKPALNPASDANAKPAPEVKTTAPVPKEVDDFVNNLSEKSKSRFLELSNARAETLVAERMKAAKILTPEIEQEHGSLKKTVETLTNELRQVGVERSPEYMTKFVERPKAIEARLTAIAKMASLPETELVQAMRNDNSPEGRRALNELLSQIGPMDVAEVSRLVQEHHQIDSDRAGVNADLELAAKTINQRRTEQTQEYVRKLTEERVTTMEKAVLPACLKELEANGIFEGDEGAAERTEFLAAVNKANTANLEKLPPQERAELIASARMSLPLWNQNKTLRERNAELEERLAKYDDVQQPTNDGKKPIQKAPNTTEKPATFMERLRAGQV